MTSISRPTAAQPAVLLRPSFKSLKTLLALKKAAELQQKTT